MTCGAHDSNGICRLVAGLAVSVAAVVGGEAAASVLIPPRNLGDLARLSAATVEAVAGVSRVSQRGSTIVTVTEATVLAAASGPLAVGERVDVVVPGGEVDGIGWAVEGAPRLTQGATYLLFLDPDANGEWRLKTLSYGVLARVAGRDGSSLLAPLAEAGAMVAWPRPDGSEAEAVGIYREADLLAHLAAVAAGTESWDSARVLAPAAALPLVASAWESSYGCPMIGESDGHPVRWKRFDQGKPVVVYSESDGEDGLGEGGGHVQVEEAVASWMGISGTNLDLRYGGARSYTMSCGGGFDMPSYSNNLVVFGDPCSDLDGMTECAGIAAYGGPWYKGTHDFNGRTWSTAVGLYVIVNDGAACLGREAYRRLIAHELGHGLGFAHSEDPAALMYRYCCNSYSPTDVACARSVYPGGNQGVAGVPAAVEASDGTLAGVVEVSWTGVPGASAYDVWRGSVPRLDDASPVGEAVATLFIDETAEPGVAYHYWVRARAGAALGEFSEGDEGFAACSAPPAPALAVPATASSGEPYTVSWEPVEGAVAYLVDESTDARFTAPLAATSEATSMPFAHSVTSPTVYYYRVTPLLACGTTSTAGAASEVRETTVLSAASDAPSTVLYLPGAAHVEGANGESWRTDLEIHNPDEALATVLVELLGSGATTGEPEAKTLMLEGGRTASYEDVVATVFGRTGTGVLRVSSSIAGVIVSARTYNRTASGTFGQFIPQFTPADGVAGGETARLVQLAHAVDRAHGRRSNIGLVNASGTPTVVTVSLYAASGARLGERKVALDAHGAVQVNDVFAGLTSIDVTGGYAEVAPAEPQARVLAYASIVDNLTGDPVFVPAR